MLRIRARDDDLAFPLPKLDMLQIRQIATPHLHADPHRTPLTGVPRLDLDFAAEGSGQEDLVMQALSQSEGFGVGEVEGEGTMDVCGRAFVPGD